MLTRRHFLRNTCGALAALALAARATGSVPPPQKLRLKKGDCILFYGDSITDANRNREIAEDSVPSAMGGGYAMSAASYLACKYPNMGLRFWNRGINGNKTAQMIERLDKDCLGLKVKPTVVSVLTGVNDCSLALKSGAGDPAKYEADLRELLTRIQSGIPGVRIVLMEPYIVAGLLPKTDRLIPHFPAYRAVAAKLAREFSAVFVPLQARFDEACQKYGKGAFCRDGIHPWAGGVELIAQAWLNAVEMP